MLVSNIIIGAGRSGTTSLVEYLKQHPEINFSTIKEVTYFSVKDHYERGEDYFHSFFEKKHGLPSTSDTYLLMDKDAPARIFQYNPKAKLIVILREPSKRTFSNFQYSINNGYIPNAKSFVGSQSDEDSYLLSKDIAFLNNHCSFYGSLYHRHLMAWLKYFSKDQLFICTTNQLINNPQETLNQLFCFLGVSKREVNIITPKNKASGVKNVGLNNFLINRNHWLRKILRKPLQLSFVRNFIFKTGVVEKIKETNRTDQVYREMTVEEKQFCDNYFKEDLILLKKDFGIEF